METDPQFLRYAGIHGPVLLYTTPVSFIDDIKVFTWSEGIAGYVKYAVRIIKQEPVGDNSHHRGSRFDTEEPVQSVKVQLEDQARNIIAQVEMSACTGISKMPAPVPVPAGTGQPERRGCMCRPGQAARGGAQARAAGVD